MTFNMQRLLWLRYKVINPAARVLGKLKEQWEEMPPVGWGVGSAVDTKRHKTQYYDIRRI